MSRSKRVLLTVFVGMLVLSHAVSAGEYHVNADIGVDDFSLDRGSLSMPWKSITHASDHGGLQAGDIVYVWPSSAPYSAETINGLTGTDEQPIVFVGLGSGGLDNGEGVPDEYEEIQSTGPSRGYPASSVTPSPHIEGPGRTTSHSVALVINNCEYVEFRNFWVSDAQDGVWIQYCDYCEVENVYVFNCGNPDVGEDDGRGIKAYHSFECSVLNCVCYNIGYMGMEANESMKISYCDCTVYCDDNSGTVKSNTHYYFFAGINSSDCVFTDCEANRLLDVELFEYLAHPGHGFTADAKDGDQTLANTFERCHGYNLGELITVRGDAVRNRFLDCKGFVEYPNDQQAWNNILVASGAKYNLFHGILLQDARDGVNFQGWISGYATLTTIAVEGNWFENCVFDVSRYGIKVNDWPNGNPTLAVVDNQFVNCTFYGQDAADLFYVGRDSNSNIMANCIFANFSGFADIASGYSADLEFTAIYSLFDTVSEFPPEFTDMPGNLSGDADFLNAENNDFNIGSNSDARDVGETYSITTDIDEDERDAQIDIGAQEYLGE